MDVKKILEQVSMGTLSPEEAGEMLKNLPYEDLGYAKLDLHRKLRSGFPETVYCQGKPDQYLADIFDTLYRENGEVMGTRATEQQYLLVKERIPGIIYDPVSRILKAEPEGKERKGCVAVCTDYEGKLCHHNCRHGRRPWDCRSRAGGESGYRSSHVGRLRCEFSRTLGAAYND